MTKANLRKALAKSVAVNLQQGVDLLNEMDDRLYTAAGNGATYGGGAVGGHFRHCLEFVNCFLAGARLGRIDYDGRARDSRIEADREYAIVEFLRTIQELEDFSLHRVEDSLLVKPEDVLGDEFWCGSSPERELEFLQSHTVHHYALIAFKLRASHFLVPADFGVAPSTLRFWKRENIGVWQIRYLGRKHVEGS